MKKIIFLTLFFSTLLLGKAMITKCSILEVTADKKIQGQLINQFREKNILYYKDHRRENSFYIEKEDFGRIEYSGESLDTFLNINLDEYDKIKINFR